MSVNSTSGLGAYPLDQVTISQAGQAGSVAGVRSPENSGSVSDSSIDVANLSAHALVFSGLQSLSGSDPAQFKRNTANIARQLESAAQKDTDLDSSDLLRGTAAAFGKASESGSFSDLFSSEALHAGTGDPGFHTVAHIFSNAVPAIYQNLQN